MLTDAEIGQVTAGLLQRAVELLQDGALVAFPTDTVYGVGAVVWSAVAVGRLYVAKQRLTDKAIPVLLADLDDLVHVSRALPSAAWCLAERFWPGPLTLIVPRATRVPDAVTAGGDSVAVRIPDHALARSLIRRTGASLATTSANLAGAPNAITAAEVARADQAELLEQREHSVRGRAVDAAAQRLRALDDLVDAQVCRRVRGRVPVRVPVHVSACVPVRVLGERRECGPDGAPRPGEAVAAGAQRSRQLTVLLRVTAHVRLPSRRSTAA